MTGEIINFRKAKKVLDRAAKEKQAAENRIKFGRTKAEREKIAADEELKRRRIDEHVREAKDRAKDAAEDDPA